MASHPIAIKVENAMQTLIAAALTTDTIRGSEHVGKVWEPRSIFVTVDAGDGVEPLTGNAECTIRVEVRTMLDLYSSFTTAVSDHYTKCGTAFDTLMDSALATSLTVTGLTIQGVKSGETQTNKMDGDTLVSSMSRVVLGVPQ